MWDLKENCTRIRCAVQGDLVGRVLRPDLFQLVFPEPATAAIRIRRTEICLFEWATSLTWSAGREMQNRTEGRMIMGDHDVVDGLTICLSKTKASNRAR